MPLPSFKTFTQLAREKLNRNGSIPLTGDLNADNHKILNLISDHGPSLPTTSLKRGRTYLLNLEGSSVVTPYFFDGVTWIEYGGSGAGSGSYQYTYLMDVLSQEAHLKVPASIADSFVITGFQWVATPSLAEATDLGIHGYEQLVTRVRKGTIKVTGNVSTTTPWKLGVSVFGGSDNATLHKEHIALNGSTGVEVVHNLGTAEHSVFAAPATLSEHLSLHSMLGAGVVWVQRGENSDIVYATGNKKVPYHFIATTNNSYTSFEAPTDTIDDVTGVDYAHDNSPTHMTALTLVCDTPVSAIDVLNIGDYWAVPGASIDKLYISGPGLAAMKLQATYFAA